MELRDGELWRYWRERMELRTYPEAAREAADIASHAISAHDLRVAVEAWSEAQWEGWAVRSRRRVS